MRNSPQKNTRARYGWFIPVLLTLVLLTASFISAGAQSANNDWEPPVNLSRSGGAFNPSIVIDNNGVSHMIWADAFAGFMYSVLGEEGWSPPKPVIFPFSPPRNVTIGRDYPTPVLFSDQRNRIHAFWIDGRGVLNHSSVSVFYIDSPGSWTGNRVIGDSVIAMDVTMDINKNIHIAYIRNSSTQNSPAGLYYRGLNTNSYVWSLPQLLDESPYFRTLTEVNSNVSISATLTDEAVNLIIGWDNRPRNRISLIKSEDSGNSWGEPIVLEGPEVSTNPVIPINVMVGSYGRNILLVWQEDEPGESCNQVYQFSDDGGETWGSKQRMLTNLQGCAQEYRFLITDSGQIILMTKILGQVYFQAWDGNRWSDPQLQTILSSFIDQETFNLVDLECQFFLLTPENTLFVAGCDRGIGGDVWFTSRQLDDIDSWFPTDSGWSNPINIASSIGITLPSSAASDSAGNIHFIWSMLEDLNDEGASLQYARSDGSFWSPPQNIFGPPIYYVGESSLASFGNQLFAVWNDPLTGEILFTSVPAGRATNPREWLPPTAIPLPRQEASSPTLVAGWDGTLYLTYVIPINELRGVYISKSGNSGISWNEPGIVFDAVNAGWPIVDHPKMSIGSDGKIHLVFSRYNANNRSIGFYYTMSDDDGETWSEIEVVTEASISFSDIRVAGNGAVHIVWQEDGDAHTLWHAYFHNGDEVLERRQAIQNSPTETAISPLLEDASGDIHLLQLSHDGISSVILKHWIWNEPQWNVVELVPIQVPASDRVGGLVGSVTEIGKMVAIYSLPIVDQRTNAEVEILFSVSRAMSSGEPTSARPVITEQVETPIVQTATPPATVEPTPETALIVNDYRPEIDPAPVDRPNQWVGLVIGAVGGGILTILVFLIAVRSVRRRGLK